MQPVLTIPHHQREKIPSTLYFQWPRMSLWLGQCGLDVKILSFVSTTSAGIQCVQDVCTHPVHPVLEEKCCASSAEGCFFLPVSNSIYLSICVHWWSSDCHDSSIVRRGIFTTQQIFFRASNTSRKKRFGTSRSWKWRNSYFNAWHGLNHQTLRSKGLFFEFSLRSEPFLYFISISSVSHFLHVFYCFLCCFFSSFLLYLFITSSFFLRFFPSIFFIFFSLPYGIMRYGGFNADSTWLHRSAKFMLVHQEPRPISMYSSSCTVSLIPWGRGRKTMLFSCYLEGTLIRSHLRMQWLGRIVWYAAGRGMHLKIEKKYIKGNHWKVFSHDGIFY